MTRPDGNINWIGRGAANGGVYAVAYTTWPVKPTRQSLPPPSAMAGASRRISGRIQPDGASAHTFL